MKPFWRREEVEDRALLTLLEFRRRTGMRMAAPIDVDLIGELGCGLQWDWDVLPEPPSTLVWAALLPQEGRVVLNESHADKFAANRGLERFTKAHEIGHWILHVDHKQGDYAQEVLAGIVMQGTIAQIEQRASQDKTYWMERHADWFAAALLMPATLFVPAAERCNLSSPNAVSHLARKFDVSLAATRARLTQLGFQFAGATPIARSQKMVVN
jgi:hypothetical protein